MLLTAATGSLRQAIINSLSRPALFAAFNCPIVSRKYPVPVPFVFDIRGRNDPRIAIGQTGEGRYLRVIYVPDPVPDSVFVITAYELGPKAKRAIRRRKRKKR